ncbi:MAG: mCpol domain-containing protein [Okeania sp. SIO3H1]|nr:mCpol domain-containing protein [Okeania sp. SIO3H1]
MNIYQKSFKLILAGNTNIPAMINAIIGATIQARNDTKNSDLTFRQVHIFHSEQSLQALTTSVGWQEAISNYKIYSTSLVHHVTKIEDSNAGVEEVANIILTIIKSADLDNKTLGKKLDEVRNIFSQNPKYFVNTETLEHITRLITSVRNDIAHPSSENSYSKDIIAIQSRLSSQLAFAFIQFTTKTLSSFLDQNGQLVNVQILETPTDKNQTIFYFGFDGDSTGDYLEMAFEKSNEDEVRQRSQIVHEVIGELKKLIYKATKDNKSVLFAEGDNILFKAPYQVSLLNDLQRIYKERTGLTGTIGYGKTLPEVALAMRLAKAQGGGNIMGIALKN